MSQVIVSFIIVFAYIQTRFASKLLHRNVREKVQLSRSGQDEDTVEKVRPKCVNVYLSSLSVPKLRALCLGDFMYFLLFCSLLCCITIFVP